VVLKLFGGTPDRDVTKAEVKNQGVGSSEPTTAFFCNRSSPYEIMPEFVRALSLITQRLNQ
jgi:hypothetical protein